MSDCCGAPTIDREVELARGDADAMGLLAEIRGTQKYEPTLMCSSCHKLCSPEPSSMALDEYIAMRYPLATGKVVDLLISMQRYNPNLPKYVDRSLTRLEEAKTNARV